MDAKLQTVAMLLLLVVLLVGLWWYKRRDRGRGDVLAGLSLPLPLTVLQDGLLDAVSQATVGMGECVMLKVADGCPDDMVAVSTECCGYATVALAEGRQSVDNADTPPPGTVWTAFVMNYVSERFIDKLLPGLNLEERMGLDRLTFLRKGMQWTDRLLKSRRIHRLKQLKANGGDGKALFDEMFDDLLAEDYVKNSTQTDLDDGELEATKTRVAGYTDDELDDLMRRSGLESSYGELDLETRLELKSRAKTGDSGSVLKIRRRAQFRRAMEWMENPMEEFVTRAKMEMWDFGRYSKEIFSNVMRALRADGVGWLRRIARMAINVARLLMKGVVKLVKLVVAGIMTLGLTFLIDGLGFLLESFDLRGKNGYVETGRLLEFRNKAELSSRIVNYNFGRLVSLKDHRGSLLEQLHAPVIEPFFVHWCSGGHLLSLVNSTYHVTVASREALRTKATLSDLTENHETTIDKELLSLIGDLVTTYVFPSDYMYEIADRWNPSDWYDREPVGDEVLIEDLNALRDLEVSNVMELVASGDREELMKQLQDRGGMHAFVNGYKLDNNFYAYDVERDYVTGQPLNTEQSWHRLIKGFEEDRPENAVPRGSIGIINENYSQGYTAYRDGIQDRLENLGERLNAALDNIWASLNDRDIAFVVFETAKAYLKTCPAILSDEQRVQLLCWLRKQSMDPQVKVNVNDALGDELNQEEDATYKTLLEVWRDQYHVIMQFDDISYEEPDALDENNYYKVIVHHLRAAWKLDVIDGGDSAMSAFTADLTRLKTPVDRTSEICLALSRVDVDREVKKRIPPGVASSNEEIDVYDLLVYYLVESLTFTEEGVRSLERWNVDNQFTESQFGEDAEIAYLSQDRPRMLWVSQYRSYLPNNAPSGLTAEMFYSSPDTFLGTDMGAWGSGYGANAGQTNAPVPVYHKVPQLQYAIAGEDALQTPLTSSDGVVQNTIVTSGYMAHLSYTSALEDMCTRKPPRYNNTLAQWDTDSHAVSVKTEWIDEAAKQKWMATNPSWIDPDGTIKDELMFYSKHQEQPAKRHIITYMLKAYLSMVPEGEHSILAKTKIEGTDHLTLDPDDEGLTAYYRPFQEITQFAKARFGVRFNVRYGPVNGANEFFQQSHAIYDPSPDVNFDRERALCERTQPYCKMMGGGSMQDYDVDGRFVKRFEYADGSGDTSGHKVLGLAQKPQDCKFSGVCKALELLGPASELCTPLAEVEGKLYEADEYMEDTFNSYRADCSQSDIGACAMTGLTAVPHVAMTGLVAEYELMSDGLIAAATGLGDAISVISDAELWKDLDETVREDCGGWLATLGTVGISCVGGADISVFR
jgi:hypothetical protein